MSGRRVKNCTCRCWPLLRPNFERNVPALICRLNGSEVVTRYASSTSRPSRLGMVRKIAPSK